VGRASQYTRRVPRSCRASLSCLIVLLGAALFAAELRAEPQASAAVQRYQLEATLDPKQQRVRGRMRLSFTNHSSAALPSLVFHLYLNAFRDSRSVFMRESGGRLRQSRAQGRGEIRLESLRVGGAERLPDAATELVAGDFTQLSLPLTQPLAPGASTLIESEFVALLPPLFARSGHHADFFAVAQWFPKLAKLEPDGHFESFPYHGLGEFYADFASYELRVRTPAAYQVVASGELISEQPHGKEQVERLFRAERVHDVAFFAAPDFVRTRERMGPVDVVFLAPPGYDLAQLEHANVVRRGLAHFGARFGAYPYQTLSVVLPPRGADGAAGMEYPGLIVTDGEWLPLPLAPSLSGAIVSAHELAHQWFYGLLASHEVRHPVLDEGLAEWATLDLMRTMYGRTDALLGQIGPDRFELTRSFVLSLYSSISPGLPAPSYSASEYATSVYGRAALALESIRRAHGAARFDAALARYARVQRFGHPTPDDLAAAFDHSYGAGFSERVLRPLLFAGEVSAVRLLEVSSTERSGHHVTQVHARREGAVALPCWVALYDLEGRELRRVPWKSELEVLQIELETASAVARVVVDPDRALLLDRETRDQIWVLSARPEHHWLLQLGAAAQLLLAWFGP
jgi:hypothetical protein